MDFASIYKDIYKMYTCTKSVSSLTITFTEHTVSQISMFIMVNGTQLFICIIEWILLAFTYCPLKQSMHAVSPKAKAIYTLSN